MKPSEFPPGPPRRLTALVSGKVQMVGYRRFVQRRANDLHLNGFVENLADGRVEVVAEGDQKDLDRLRLWLRQGPVHADVRDVEVQWAEGTGLTGFYEY
ncbi:MAG TPA: acylphosphatase [Deinococcales bacterium]|nr:acylphosphatase [Deinococcales bacterium]